jgi:hypothetical protein
LRRSFPPDVLEKGKRKEKRIKRKGKEAIRQDGQHKEYIKYNEV